MAEYINKSEVNGLLKLGWSGDAIVTAITNGGISSVNVVERSKIDKAIKEMESIPLYAAYTRGDIRQMCIDILKRNIGESKCYCLPQWLRCRYSRWQN